MNIPLKKSKFFGIHNLTHQSFFNQLTKRYPHATECFFNWFSNYMIKITSEQQFVFFKNAELPKEPLGFDKLPFEMQMGIVVYFFHDILDKNQPNFLNFSPVNELIGNFETYATWAFSALEKIIEKDKSGL